MSINRFAVAAVVAAAGPALGQAKALSETCPSLSSAQVQAIENYKGQFAEFAWYARDNCVPIEEAERRAAIQALDAIGPKTEPGPPPAPPPHSIGSIAAALGEKEADSFAGLWIEHRPRHRVVVAFTRDAARTLAKYTSDPLFVPVDRPGPTLAELDATRERLSKIFVERGYRLASAGRMEQHGKVTFQLAQEAAPIRAAAARGEFELPSWVELNEPRPYPVPAPPARSADTRVKAFPQLKHRTDMYPSTEVGVRPTPATLELRDGCLLVIADNVTRVALWSAEDALDLSDPNQVSIVNRLSGVRIRAGERVSLTGLQPGIEDARIKSEKVGESPACPGPYRVVNGYQLQSAFEVQDREDRVRALMYLNKLTRSAAEARYAAKRKRLTELQALRTKLVAEHGNVLGGASTNEEEAKLHLFLLPGVKVARLVPPRLRPHIYSQTVPRTDRELEAAKTRLEAQLQAAGVKARVGTEVVGGTLLVWEIADLRKFSAAVAAGKVTLPAFARLSQSPALPLGGYVGIGWDETLQRYEQAPDFNHIRALVAATDVPGYPAPGKTERRLGKPTRAQSLEIAHWMMAYGFDDADRLAALQRAGADPIDAWVRQNGLSTPANRAVLAEQVVIAEPVEINMKDPGTDGYRSTVTWRVVETLKGSARPGELLKQRLISGEEPGGDWAFGHDEPMLVPGCPNSLDTGSRWLLHLSRGPYRRQSLMVGGDGAARANAFASWQAPARVTDGRVYLQPSDQEPVSLEALRKEIAPVQRAFVKVGGNRP